MSDLFIDEGQRRKEEGIAKVSQRNPMWLVSAIYCIKQIPPGTELPWQTIKGMIVGRIGNPPHANMWGAVTRDAKKHFLLIEIGRCKCTDVKAQKRGGGQAIYKRG